MEVTGRLTRKLPLQEGEGKNGHWVKGQFVLQLDNEYATLNAFITFSNEVVEMLNNVAEGELLTASFELSSREYNGRWYTDLRCYRLARAGAQQPTIAEPQRIMPQNPMEYDPFALDDEPPF